MGPSNCIVVYTRVWYGSILFSLVILLFPSDEEADSDDEAEGEEAEAEEEEEAEDDDEEENESSGVDTTLDTSKEESKVDMSKLTKSQKKRLKKKLAQQAKDKPQVNGVDKSKVKFGDDFFTFLV